MKHGLFVVRHEMKWSAVPALLRYRFVANYEPHGNDLLTAISPLAISVTVLLMVAIAATALPAVTLEENQKGAPHKPGAWERELNFGGDTHYLVRLWAYYETVDEKPLLREQGLGLRWPYEEERGLLNSWYQNGFMNLILNGKPLLSGKMLPASSFGPVEQGERALGEYCWFMAETKVRVRFMMRDGCPAIFAEWLVEADKPMQETQVTLCCFPALFTKEPRTREEGDRRALTATEEVVQGQEAKLEPLANRWVLYYDRIWDLADPTRRTVPRTGFGVAGPCGLFFLPESVTSLHLQPTDYPINTVLTLKPRACRVRLAFVEFPGKSVAQAREQMLKLAPPVEEILTQDSFLPSAITTFDAARERERLAVLERTGRVAQADLLAAGQDLDALASRTAPFRDASQRSRLERPISSELEVNGLLSQYERGVLALERRARRSLKILALNGFMHECFRLDDAVQSLGQVPGETKEGFFSVTPWGYRITYFPRNLREMYEFDAVMLLDIDPVCIGPGAASLLKQYVEDGGGLMVFGGLYSFGASRIAETPLAELLPLHAEVAPFGLRQGDKVPLKRSSRPSSLLGLHWPEGLCSPWYHELSAVEDAEVLVRVAESPWLAARAVGKGRVVACGGTILGESSKHLTAFSASSQWPDIFAHLLLWCCSKDRALGEGQP